MVGDQCIGKVDAVEPECTAGLSRVGPDSNWKTSLVATGDEGLSTSFLLASHGDLLQKYVMARHQVDEQECGMNGKLREPGLLSFLKFRQNLYKQSPFSAPLLQIVVETT